MVQIRRRIVLFTALLSFGAVHAAEGDLLLILDASNSMWGQIDGVNKVVIAREAVGGLIDGLPESANVGLIAYGHRRESDCEDIEVLRGVTPVDKAELKSTINAINPKGRTPITSSINAAIDLARDRDHTAIVLISDGLETCGLDPCGAVRTAKAQGLPFVLHVVGFDVAGENTAQLECAAQEGGGLYLDAENATELSAALKSAYERPTEPDGRLVVTATADGGLQDALIVIRDAETGQEVASSRTYVGEETNPRRVPLPDGSYRAVVSAVNIEGSANFEFDFEIRDGGSEERAFDFSAGEIAVHVTRNGELSDATVRVRPTGEQAVTASGRTYRSAENNPRVLRVAAGTYDVAIRSVEIENAAEPQLERIVVNGGQRSDVAHEFASGDLQVGVRRGDVLVDAVVRVHDETGRNVAGGRTYVSDTSNPKSFVLVPGSYTIRISEIRGEEREMSVVLTQGQLTGVDVDFASE